MFKLKRAVEPRKKYNVAALFMAFALALPCAVAYAEPVKTTAITDTSKIWACSGDNSYNSDGFGDSSAPANFIYGNTVTYKRYLGEESSGIEDSEYRSDMSGSIAGKTRNLQGLDPNNESDYHTRALANSVTSTPTAANWASGIASVPVYTVNWAASLANFDMNESIGAFISDSALGDVLKRIFLFNEDGDFSPLLAVFLVLWAFSLITFIAKWLRGQGALALIFKEIGFFALSVFMFAVCSANLVTKASSIAQDVILNLTNAFEEDLTGTTGFWRGSGYDTMSEQNIANETGLVAKTVIDYQLCGLFDVDNIDELSISGYPVSNGEVEVNNAGYLYWAGNSLLNYSAPVSGGSANISSESNNNRYYYFTVDAASALGGSVGDKIYAGITNPNTGAIAGRCLIVCLYGLVFSASYFMLAIAICALNLFMVCFGLVCFVTPALLLYPKSRSMAQDILKMGLMSIVFQAILLGVKSVLFTVFMLCNGTLPRFFIGFAILGLSMWWMPSLVKWLLKTMLSRVRFKTNVFNTIRSDMYRTAATGRYRNVKSVFADTKEGISGLGEGAAHAGAAVVRGAAAVGHAAGAPGRAARRAARAVRDAAALREVARQQGRLQQDAFPGEERVERGVPVRERDLHDVLGGEEVLEPGAGGERVGDVLDGDVLQPGAQAGAAEARDVLEGEEVLQPGAVPLAAGVADDVLGEGQVLEPQGDGGGVLGAEEVLDGEEAVLQPGAVPLAAGVAGGVLGEVLEPERQLDRERAVQDVLGGEEVLQPGAVPLAAGAAHDVLGGEVLEPRAGGARGAEERVLEPAHEHALAAGEAVGEEAVLRPGAVPLAAGAAHDVLGGHEERLEQGRRDGERVVRQGGQPAGEVHDLLGGAEHPLEGGQADERGHVPERGERVVQPVRHQVHLPGGEEAGERPVRDAAQRRVVHLGGEGAPVQPARQPQQRVPQQRLQPQQQEHQREVREQVVEQRDHRQVQHRDPRQREQPLQRDRQRRHEQPVQRERQQRPVDQPVRQGAGVERGQPGQPAQRRVVHLEEVEQGVARVVQRPDQRLDRLAQEERVVEPQARAVDREVADLLGALDGGVEE